MDLGGCHTVWCRAVCWLRNGFMLQSFSLCLQPVFRLCARNVCTDKADKTGGHVRVTAFALKYRWIYIQLLV